MRQDKKPRFGGPAGCPPPLPSDAARADLYDASAVALEARADAEALVMRDGAARYRSRRAAEGAIEAIAEASDFDRNWLLSCLLDRLDASELRSLAKTHRDYAEGLRNGAEKEER